MTADIPPREPDEPRPNLEDHKVTLAVEIATRSNCLKTHVGCIILIGDRIRATGYNGTISGASDCFDGGCDRCADESIPRGEELDRCVCVHAEANALTGAARYGISVDGAECYVTHEPCLECTKLLIQAGLKTVVYLKTYQYQTADRNVSREAMRQHAQRTGVTTFTQIKSSEAERWTRRLDEMKRKAEDYARAKGIITEAKD